jgi:hypothetical protein
MRHLINQDQSSKTVAEVLAEVEQFERDTRQDWDDGTDGVDPKVADNIFERRVSACRLFFHAFRLRFQLVVLELLSKAWSATLEIHLPALQAKMDFRVQSVQAAADKVLTCLPLLLSTEGYPVLTSRREAKFWVDGVRMVWPLRLVAIWRATRDDQKKTAQRVLENIREELGVKPNSGAFTPAPYGYSPSS